MGRLKQLLLLGDRPLLQHVVDEAARAQLGDLVVVLGHRADEVQRAVQLPQRARFVVNGDYARGMGTSLASGLRAASAHAVAAAVLLGDQPGVSALVIDAVIGAFRSGEEPIVRPVYVADGQRVPGHPVIIARHIWTLARDLRGDEGFRSIIAAHPQWLREVELRGAPPSDLDTPDDYQRMVGVRPEQAG
jgi:molybdenum cofactor cytidylyltransferase